MSHTDNLGEDLFAAAAPAESVALDGPPQGVEEDLAGPGQPWLTGPAPAPIVIGLIGLITLVSSAVWSLTDLTVRWSLAAPAAVVGLGVVIVALGLSGLRKRA